MSDEKTTYDVAGTELTVHGMRVDGKPKLGAKFIYGDCHMSYVDANGKMFSTLIQRGSWFVGKRWAFGRHLRVINDAVALGAIPKKAAVARIAKIEAERSKKRDQAYAANDVLSSMERAGVPLTPAQVRALKRKAAALKS